jgi:DNA-directed RNA polymerase specialized sigma24 family protein
MSKENKQFNRFEEVRSIIDSSNDLEMMKACQGLLRDLIRINDLEETLEKARAALYEEHKRKFFSFFIDGLPPMEVASLADKCSGRVKILEKRADAEKAASESSKPQQ